MTRQHLPLLYFGLFAVYLTVFNWGTPISWLFYAGATLAGIQIVRPRQVWVSPLFGLGVLFSLAYAGTLVRIVADTQSLTPFLTPESNAIFAWDCAVAMLNFCVVFFWFRKGILRA